MKFLAACTTLLCQGLAVLRFIGPQKIILMKLNEIVTYLTALKNIARARHNPTEPLIKSCSVLSE